MIKLLIGGSPCTYWSIAQKNGRETEANGMGWELFKNYLIAKEKFKPDFFLYENNKSAAQAIKDQIKHELDVWNETLFTEDSGARYIEINSALVSAQNRQRFYVHNCGEVGQPEDRGILLRDILESITMERSYSLSEREIDYMVRGYQDRRWNFLNRPGEDDKSKCVVANFSKGVPYNILAEPVNVTEGEKAHTLKAQYFKNGVANFITNGGFGATAVAETIRIGTIESELKTRNTTASSIEYIPLMANLLRCADRAAVSELKQGCMLFRVMAAKQNLYMRLRTA